MERILRNRCLASAPLETIQVAPGRSTASMLTVGDVCLPYKKRLQVDVALAGVRELWESADARIGNLESVGTSRTTAAASTGSSIRCPPEGLDFLRDARFTAVTVANNHSLDYGSSGLLESVQEVSARGIAYCGLSRAPGAAAAPALFEVNGIRIGMLGWCDNYRPPAFEAVYTSPGITVEEEMITAIRDLRRRVDLVIAQLHWGYEFSLHPLRTHRDIARRLAASGAHLVLCHHAHVPMGIEVMNGSLIAHGLGNFLFNLHTLRSYQAENHDWTRLSFILNVMFNREGIQRAEVIPCEILPGPSSRPLSGIRRYQFIKAMGRMSARLADTARLDRLERSRTVHETFRIVKAMVEASDTQLIERAMQLNTPLYRSLTASLDSLETVSSQRVAALFRDLAEAAPDEVAVGRVFKQVQSWEFRQTMEELRRLYSWRDALDSRLP